MTRTETALANLTAAQDAFDPIATELTHAQFARKRSASKANIARVSAAIDAFDVALAACDAAHDAVAEAEALDAADAVAAEAAALAAAEPTFL